jgi:hypothetical protein
MDFDLQKMPVKALKRLLGVGIFLAAIAFPASGAVAIIPQARKGLAKVPLAVYGMLSKKGQSLIKLGKETGKEDRKHLVRGRLIENITKGSDKGAMSAKILGSDSELNMWQPELQAGLIVLQVPQQILNMTDQERADLLKPPPD